MGNGNSLVAAAIEALLEQSPLEAKIRQRATVFGQSMSGAGHYVQMYVGERTYIRYEFKLQVADQSHSLSHINDGATLWMCRENGPNYTQQYVNVQRIRQRLQETTAGNTSGRSDIAKTKLPAPELAIGGIRELLSNLGESFVFDEPRAGELKGVPTWELTGRWKPEILLRLLPRQRVAIRTGQQIDWSELPEHLPDAVQLTLGRDQNFPLFPYRMEYQRTRRRLNVTGAKSTAEVVEPLLALDLFELRHRPDLEPGDFSYQPRDGFVQDLTDMYERRLSSSVNSP
jgi:hypothetical protein